MRARGAKPPSVHPGVCQNIAPVAQGVERALYAPRGGVCTLQGGGHAKPHGTHSRLFPRSNILQCALNLRQSVSTEIVERILNNFNFSVG